MSEIAILIIAFVSFFWGLSNFQKRKSIEDEIYEFRIQKWKQDLDKIRARYRDADIQSVVDKSNEEWNNKLGRKGDSDR
jgi:hypothetical protein